APAATSGQAAPVVLLQLQGALGPATTEYLRRGLVEADARRAAAVVLRIDTPGGLVSSTRDIVRAIIASPVPVIGYVAPGGARAASAGTYILYACHVAAMAPGTNIGAATPVQMGNGDPSDDAPNRKPGEPADAEPAAPPGSGAHERKAVNDAAAFIRSLAEMRGRNARWAEESVRGAASLAAREAQQQRVVDLVADDTQDLLNQVHGREVRANASAITLATRDATLVELEPDWRTRVLAVITDPNIAYILLLLGIYGILFEMMNPGIVLPGALGAVALVTALFALNMLPVSYAGLGLVVLGIALMAAEAFTPTLGLLGAAGVALFAFGSLFLYDSQATDFSLSVPLVIGAAAASALLLFLIFFAALRAQRRRVIAGGSTHAGQHVVVLSWQGHGGLVRAGGETWQARSDRYLAPGQPAVIESRQGLVLVVRALAPTQEESP
ncbi:MAG TPA: nodulation protein NfeD, partial [Bordetella sp.]|nr:nodulation protein NfeD [Bordetella sp.]